MLKEIAGRGRTRYFEEPCSPSPRVLIRVCIAFTELHTQCAQLLARIARRKSNAREAHLTGALGHGRFDAGAKMTDKRRVAKSSRVCSWEIMYRREPFKSYAREMSRMF